MPIRAVVGFGANLGDRIGTMRAALRELARKARVERTSRVYETEPVGGVEQPEFLNAAALVEYEGSPESLLEELLTIERRLGRVRGERWGPRNIDLDVLWIEGFAVQSERITVPHPRLKERAFAMAPLLEVAPEARDPVTGAPYALPGGVVRATSETLGGPPATT